MSLPFTYREYNFSRNREGPRYVDIPVTAENFLDVLISLVESRPTCAYREIAEFSIYCCDFWNPPEGFAANSWKNFHPYKEYAAKFIHFTYGQRIAPDREFVYSLVCFMIDRLEKIDKEFTTQFGIPLSFDWKRNE